jgi:sulfur carrier protein
MEIVLNGKSATLDDRASVVDLLSSLELADKRVAVEVNGQIVPRSQHPTHELCENDRVEVVVAVGGG